MASPLRSLAYLLPQIWRVLRQGPRTTVKFPFGPAELPEGYRGRVVIRAENCRGCNMCVRDCPAFALELERNGRDAYRLIYHPERCAYCGQCELSCNFDAIYLSNEFVPGEPDRADLSVVLVNKEGKEDTSA
jgi:formate hydrogenlyase subunit 6/NADH:ubiquinone oxidoreductase subunit I